MTLSAQEERTLLSTIQDLQDRLYRLERQRTPSGAIPRGEGIQVLDRDDGSVIAQIGDLSGTDGIMMGSSGAALWWDQDRGLLLPFENFMFIDGNNTKVVTSATFVETWRGSFAYAQSSWVKVGFNCSSAASTAGEVRVRIGTFTSTALAIPAGSFYCQGWFNLRGVVTKYSGPIYVYLDARRTSGAGNVNINQPLEGGHGYYGDHAPDDGTTVWSLV